MMKKAVAFIFTLAITFTLVLPAAQAASFYDVPRDHWAANEIYRLTDTGLVSGHEDGGYHPGDNITRAEAASIIARGLSLDTESTAPVSYSDVSSNHYAAEAIETVTKAGIMLGNNGEFHPNDPLTRAQLAVVLTNIFGFEANNEINFSDVAPAYHAYNHIDALVSNNITAGYDDNTFRPNNSTSRAEFAALLIRAFDANNWISSQVDFQESDWNKQDWTDGNSSEIGFQESDWNGQNWVQ